MTYRDIASGKLAMLYFSEQPARLDSVDNKQYDDLRRFKESCKGRGLYQTYDSHSQFKERFYHHLQLKLNQHQMFTAVSTAPDNSESFGNPTVTQLPNLSDEARRLLKEVSQDSHGTIMLLRHLGGTDLQTNGKSFIEDQNRRTVARWEAALEQLRRESLVIERGYKGEIFDITERGFQVADYIEL